MFNFFKTKVPNITIQNLGEFKYYKDKTDQYWERTKKYTDNENSIDIDFLALSGEPSKINFIAENYAKKLINNPNKLWSLADGEFIKSASEDIAEISNENVKKHFYIKSLTIETESSFEIGFHAYKPDVFIELFVVNGTVSKLEKDYGCCE